MSQPDDEQPLDPAAAQMVARIRRLLIISGLTTMLAVAAVLSVIGYRVFRSGGSAAPTEVTALLPQGARIVSTAVTEDRLVVTLESQGGAIEVRTFDLQTLRPAGRLRFATEP
ncbi:MAG: hypothetical protein AB7S93_04840 [Xanthobacteraceae bacterium]